jgi:inorganic pyrophosphatase
MSILENVPPGTEEKINVVVEIPMGSKNKLEYDKDNHIFKLDRVLYSTFAYPADYGFIPQTHCDDGDPLDAFVIMRQGTYPGILIEARPVAVMYMIDGGEEDNKLICVPADDPYFKEITDKSHLPAHFLEELQHFMEHYKDLENKKVVITGYGDLAKAKQEFKKSVKMYKELKK